MNTADPSEKSTTVAKSRSCAVCRSRKVRCDKCVPCSNCRRAKIVCVQPKPETQPRWARHLHQNILHGDNIQADHTDDHVASGRRPVKDVAHKLRDIEKLVQTLRNELEQGPSEAADADPSKQVWTESDSAAAAAEEDKTQASDLDAIVDQKRPGRMVIEDSSQRRYISNSFWSRIDDELNDLHERTTQLSEVESNPLSEGASFESTPASHNAHMAHLTPSSMHIGNQYATSATDVRLLHPPVAQRAFLLDVFENNVNFYLRVVHMPTILKLNGTIDEVQCEQSPESALFFAIYYAAVSSLEDGDVTSTFGCSKWGLRTRFRSCLEMALDKADYLGKPTLTSVQAFAIFVLLLRRHDSPSYVFMVTGLVIRMALYLGIHRDGSQFQHMTPYEIEMRRRIWWLICHLDLRASEDQAMDVTITESTGDTKIPLNYNEVDLDPNSEMLPMHQNAFTDMSFARMAAGLTTVTRRMTVLSAKPSNTSLEQQDTLLQEIYGQFEHEYLQYEADPDNIIYWVTKSIARLVTAKMTLIVFLPVLFPSAEVRVSDEVSARLIVSAIEVAEFNHELNDNPRARQWRWVYQTHTHWYSIVYLLIITAQCPWSPIAERAWNALQSPWLIPSRARTNEHSKIWVPLWKLMRRARRNREAEMIRLRADPEAVERLVKEDQVVPLPASQGQYAPNLTKIDFVLKWRSLIEDGSVDMNLAGRTPLVQTRTNTGIEDQPQIHHTGVKPSTANLTSSTNTDQHNFVDRKVSNEEDVLSFLHYDSACTDGRHMGPSTTPWLWAKDETGFAQDTDWSDLNMNMDFDWHDWIASAKEMA